MSSKPHQTPKIKTQRGSGLESLLHSEHIVQIEKMAIGGAGVARLFLDSKAVVVFVKKSAPEDQLKIKVTQVEKNYLIADIIDILKPSPYRRTPPCIYADRCGGCSWQHFNEDAQLLQKEILLQELFKKFIPNQSFKLSKSVQSPNLFGYRNRIQLKQMGSQLGYFEDGSHTIVDIETCLIADQKISEQIIPIKNKLKPSNGLMKYEFKINTDGQFEYYKIGQKGEGLSFSQVNESVNNLLINQTLEIVKTFPHINTMTELYAGAGNFTFELLSTFKNLSVEAVELNPELTKHAVQKLLKLGLQKKLTLFTTDCGSYVQRRSLSNDFIFVDPPRAGLEAVVTKKIAKTSPEHLIYVSCHPVSLARDLQLFLSETKSSYDIKHLQIFDMFPQTDHFETLIYLSKANPVDSDLMDA